MAKGRLQLVGAHEIRLLLGGISRQRVYQLTRRSDFPGPAADLGQGKVWFTDDVEEWIKSRRRPRGMTSPAGYADSEGTDCRTR
jgi:prophage regulatory protein